MNEPLEKIGPIIIPINDKTEDLVPIFSDLANKFDRAIDRINQLERLVLAHSDYNRAHFDYNRAFEAKYENHYHEYESYAELAPTSEPMQFVTKEERIK